MRKIGAIFDWDGVVINSANLHEESWEILAKELEFNLPHDHFVRGFGKKNETIIGKILRWSEDQVKSLIGEVVKKKSIVNSELKKEYR